jgi:ribose 5-phosphate isomerase B
MKWVAGSDHAGFQLKQALIAQLRALGDEVVDVGAEGEQPSVDYPDFAERVARAVVAEPGVLGVLCCGSGIGVSIAANKVAGVRAACVSEAYSAEMARRHNDANVLCMGERVIGPGAAEEAVRAFRDARFEGGRHQRRVDKLTALDGRRRS